MRDLTNEEIVVLRHVCSHGWVDEAAAIDRTVLAAQIEHLSAKPGCEVEKCPCLDFAYHGQQAWPDDPPEGRATSEDQVVLVMDVRDSAWTANLFVVGGIISWLEFSSYSDDYPTRMPEVSELV